MKIIPKLSRCFYVLLTWMIVFNCYSKTFTFEDAYGEWSFDSDIARYLLRNEKKQFNEEQLALMTQRFDLLKSSIIEIDSESMRLYRFGKEYKPIVYKYSSVKKIDDIQFELRTEKGEVIFFLYPDNIMQIFIPKVNTSLSYRRYTKQEKESARKFIENIPNLLKKPEDGTIEYPLRPTQ